MKLRKNPDCPACGTHEINELIDYDQFCGIGDPCRTPTPIPQISAIELAERLRRGDDIDLIDVREPYEWEIARIPGARLLPFADVSRPPSPRSTARATSWCSARAVDAAPRRPSAICRRSGSQAVWNLRGGIDAWSADVDRTVPTY